MESARDLAPAYRTPLTREKYDRMVEAGILTKDDKVELLYGVLVEMSPQGSEHVHALMHLNRALTRRLNDRAFVRVQLPLPVSGDSVPEPDFAVIPLDHDPQNPLAGLLLAVEVERDHREIRFRHRVSGHRQG
ncbi:MAG: Uma2 family endonuclease, partial [Myxococcota bacterium]